MSNLTIPPAQWLAELFACEYCAECGGDAQHHTAVPFLGNWFARCDYTLTDAQLDAVPDDAPQSAFWHPVIAAYRKAAA
jgi:hypothetical protein